MLALQIILAFIRQKHARQQDKEVKYLYSATSQTAESELKERLGICLSLVSPMLILLEGGGKSILEFCFPMQQKGNPSRTKLKDRLELQTFATSKGIS